MPYLNGFQLLLFADYYLSNEFSIDFDLSGLEMTQIIFDIDHSDIG